MKVICVKKSEIYEHHRKLQIGKQYLLQENFDSVYIRNLDGSNLGFYPKDFFMCLDEWRNQKLNTLFDLDEFS